MANTLERAMKVIYAASEQDVSKAAEIFMREMNGAILDENEGCALLLEKHNYPSLAKFIRERYTDEQRSGNGQLHAAQSSEREAMQQEREMLIYWLLRANEAMRREGYEEGPSSEDTRQDIRKVLFNIGYAPEANPIADKLLKRAPVFAVTVNHRYGECGHPYCFIKGEHKHNE